jgi:hypothetical protein
MEPASPGSNEAEPAPLGPGEAESVPLGSNEVGAPRGVGRDGNYVLNRPGELIFIAISSLPPGIPNVDTRQSGPMHSARDVGFRKK